MYERALIAGDKECFEIGQQCFRRLDNARGGHWTIVFLGEVDIVGQESLEGQRSLAQQQDSSGESSIQLAQRHVVCSRASRVNQVTHRLGL